MPGKKLDTPAKRAIAEKGITFEFLARKLGVASYHIRHNLRGSYRMPRDRAQRVADITGLPIELFLNVQRDAPSEDGERG